MSSYDHIRDMQEQSQELYRTAVEQLCRAIPFEGPGSEKLYHDLCKAVSEYGVRCRQEGLAYGRWESALQPGR